MNLLPWQRAKAQWEAENPTSDFGALVSRYMAHGGIVWSSPESFLLASQVMVASDDEVVHDTESGDTWYIHLAATSDRRLEPAELLETFVRLAPKPLAWVAWHRLPPKNVKLQRHPWKAVASRACRHAEARYEQNKC